MEQTISFYFNDYDRNKTFWAATPEQMVDGLLTTSAGSSTEGQTQLLNSNTCSGLDLGQIKKVELRTFSAAAAPNGRQAIYPVLGAGRGSRYVYDPPAVLSWAEFINITQDVRAPNNWKWYDIANLDCLIELYILQFGGQNTGYIQIRVTYEDSSSAIINVPIGSNNLAVTDTLDRDNRADTLVVSYIDEGDVVSSEEVQTQYKKEAVFGGAPLSTSLCYYKAADPSFVSTHETFYALDIIENTDPEEPILSATDPSGRGLENFPTDPSNRTFVWNGNRLAASMINYKYYWSMINTGQIALPQEEIVISEIPMATGIFNELILRKTKYTMNNVVDLHSFNMGGTPLVYGRVKGEDNYYLIISPYTYSTQSIS